MSYIIYIPEAPWDVRSIASVATCLQFATLQRHVSCVMCHVSDCLKSLGADANLTSMPSERGKAWEPMRILSLESSIVVISSSIVVILLLQHTVCRGTYLLKEDAGGYLRL